MFGLGCDGKDDKPIEVGDRVTCKNVSGGPEDASAPTLTGVVDLVIDYGESKSNDLNVLIDGGHGYSTIYQAHECEKISTEPNPSYRKTHTHVVDETPVPIEGPAYKGQF